MRFTWGHAAIAIPVTIVVVFTTVLILSMSDKRKTELVTDDYYAKEIQFQNQIDRVKQALELNTELKWSKVNENWVLNLVGDYDPNSAIGEITIYRPSDSKLDFTVPLKLDASFEQKVPHSKFKNGKYQVQVKWTVKGKDCYLEKNVFI
ncbi:MAG: hypothetical protein ACI9GM_000815 [Salibacteraceae bacterium]|jgi:hypothetical protein